MKLSARNQFQGRVKTIKLGNVMAEVVVDIGGSHEVVSAITRGSAEHLGLTQGGDRDGGDQSDGGDPCPGLMLSAHLFTPDRESPCVSAVAPNCGVRL